MDQTRSLFSTALYFRPEDLKPTALGFYDATKREIMGIATASFVDAPLEGQLAHSAFVLGTGGIHELSVPPGALLITDVWSSRSAADETITSTIQPALSRLGAPAPDQVTGIRLIGCVANPQLADFRRDSAYGVIMVWPDLQVDGTELYAAVSERLIGGGRPLLEGGGTHIAYLVGNQIVTCEVWRTEADFQRALHERIMLEVEAVFEEYKVKGDPTIIAAHPCGLGVRQELRHYPATG